MLRILGAVPPLAPMHTWPSQGQIYRGNTYSHFYVSFEVIFISGNISHSVIFAIISSSTDSPVRKYNAEELQVRRGRFFRGSVEHFADAA
jgi:hypothetical protein